MSWMKKNANMSASSDSCCAYALLQPIKQLQHNSLPLQHRHPLQQLRREYQPHHPVPQLLQLPRNAPLQTQLARFCLAPLLLFPLTRRALLLAPSASLSASARHRRRDRHRYQSHLQTSRVCVALAVTSSVAARERRLQAVRGHHRELASSPRHVRISHALQSLIQSYRIQNPPRCHANIMIMCLKFKLSQKRIEF